MSGHLAIKELAPGDFGRWDAFVGSAPEATFFHRAGWQRVIERSFGHRTFYLYAERDGVIAGVLPLVHMKSILFGKALVSVAFAVYGGPVAADTAALEALDRHATDLADRLGVDHLEYRSRRPLHSDWPKKTDLYATFRKAISDDHDANLKAIPRKQRAMVRKGIKFGLQSEVDDGIDRIHHIYAVSVRNLGTPVFPKSYFRNLREEFGADCDVVTVTHRGEAVASVMNFYFRDEVLPFYGGGTGSARTLAANDFMYWEVMRRAAERGCRLFDFGRSKVGTGSYNFKRYWGFEPEPLHYEFYLCGRDTLPDVNPLNPKYRLFIAAWKRLPLPLAKMLGPLVVRNLG